MNSSVMNNRRLRHKLDKLRDSIVALKQHMQTGPPRTVHTSKGQLLGEVGDRSDPPILTDRVTFRTHIPDKDTTM